jgi:hypothetical protein
MRPDPDLMLILFFAGSMAIGVPLVRAIARRISGSATPPAPQLPSDLAQRLERLEQIAEATQLEVERMAEGQRFTTKLLTERAQERAAQERIPDRAPERMQ